MQHRCPGQSFCAVQPIGTVDWFGWQSATAVHLRSPFERQQIGVAPEHACSSHFTGPGAGCAPGKARSPGTTAGVGEGEAAGGGAAVAAGGALGDWLLKHAAMSRADRAANRRIGTSDSGWAKPIRD